MWSITGHSASDRVRTWTEAAQDAGASGVASTAESTVLHASGWGMDPLYHRIVGDAVVFSSSVDALMAVDDAPLTPDWEAWAALLAVRYVPWDRSLVREVRRLPGSWSVHVSVSGTPTIREELPNGVAGPRDRRTPHEVIGLMDAAITGHPALATVGPTDPAALPMSGGWDSRLIGARACQLFGPASWIGLSTAKHTLGSDPDVTYGTTVAGALGITQEVLFPPVSATIDSVTDTAARVGYETWEHAWFAPATARLRAWGRPVLDGLLGDILIKNAKASPALLSAGTPERMRALMREKFVSVPDETLPGGAAGPMIADLSAPLIEAAQSRFDGCPEAARLVLMSSRIARCVALAPYPMIDPAAEVVAPLTDPRVIDALLAEPWPMKNDNAYAQVLLEEVSAGLSQHPSTNDATAARASGDLRWNAPTYVQWEDRRLASLNDTAGFPMTPKATARLRTPQAAHWRHCLTVMSLWLEKYEHRLVPGKAPWW